MGRRFVVVSGMPASGKTTLARRLAPALGLPLIDKDDILERLFESKGIGNAAWRRALSRESDLVLQAEASASTGAVLTSFWHQAGLPEDSGTPTHWLPGLSRLVVNVHCVCPPTVAAARFLARKRHAGHLDDSTNHERLVAQLYEHSLFSRLDVGPRVDVDTAREPRVDEVVREIELCWRVLNAHA
jgi:glucokinase